MKRLHLLAVTLLLCCIAIAPVMAQSTVGISEDFDGITTGVPTNWNNSDGTTTVNSNKWSSYSTGYSGRCLKFNSTNSNPSGLTNFLKTPAVNLTSGSWQLRFMYKNPNGGNFSIFISTDGGATYTTDITNGGLPNVSYWTERTILLSPYLGTNKSNVKIVFKGTSNGQMAGDANIYLDDVAIENVPTCQSPTSPTVTAITPNTATISWGLSSVGGTPTYIEMTVKDGSNVTQFTKNDISGTAGSFTIPGLQPSTTYTATLRGNCESTSQGTSRSSSITFTTACSPQNLPYVENYDGLANLSNCGYYMNASLTTTYSATQGGKSVQLSSDYNQGAFIIFPALAVSNNAVECIMKVKGTGSDIHYSIGTISDITDITSYFEPLYNGHIEAGNTSWNDVIFNTSEALYVATPCYICIRIGSGAYTSLYVDNVDIHAIPSCISPSNLQVTSVTSNTATLSWTSTASGFVVEINDGNTTTTQTATSSPYTVTGLQANSNYSFRVKAVCSASNQSAYTLNSVSCHTYCAPLSGPTLNEGAEGTTGDNLPACWLMDYLTAPSQADAKPFVTQTSNVHDGNRAFMMKGQTGTTIARLSSQAFTIPTASAYQARVWIKRDQNMNANDVLRFYAGSTPDDATTTTFLGSVPVGYRHTPAEVTEGWYDYTFPISQAGVKYLIIVGDNSNSHNPIYFDDISIEAIPSCPQPGNVIVGTTTNTTCDISWRAGGSETQWRVSYQLSKNGGAPVSNSVVVNQPSYTFSNLDASAHYTFTVDVYALCNSSDSTARHATGSFDTHCTAITNFPFTEDFESGTLPNTCENLFNPFNDQWATISQMSLTTTNKHGGSYGLYVSDGNVGNKPSLALPLMNFTDPSGYTVKFWMYRDAQYTTYTTEGFKIYVAPNNDNLFSATEVGFIPRPYNVTPAEVTAGWYEYSFDLPATATGMQYVIVTYVNQYGRPGYIDDITVQVSNNCSPITASATPSYTTADITVSDTTITSWEIAYSQNIQSATIYTDTVTGGYTYTLTGLQPNTQYVYQVRRLCSATESDWSSAQLFTTLEMAEQLPYVTSFEDDTDNAKWNITTEGWSNFYIGSDAAAVADGSKSLYVSYDNYTYGYNLNQNSQAYASRLFHFDAEEYNISFRWKCTGGEINSDSTTIYDFGRAFLVPGTTQLSGGYAWMTYGSFEGNWPTGMIPLDPTGKTYMAKATGDANGWNTLSQALNMTSRAGDYKLVFMWNNESGGVQYPLAIDQLAIRPVTCIRPVMVLSNLTSTSAQLALTNGTSYRLVVSTTPLDIYDSLMTGNIVDTVLTTTVFHLNGLTANTTYYYTALNICDSTNVSEWMLPDEFTTECLTTVPYNESFENNATISCWSAANPANMAISNARAYTGVKSLEINSTTAISPEFDITNIAPYTLTGWLYSSIAQNVEIGVAVDPTDVASYLPVATVSVPASTWYEFSTGFTAVTEEGNEDFLAARHFTIMPEQNKTLYADGIHFGMQTSCQRPTSPVITDTVHNGFTMTWTDAAAQQWIIKATPTAGGNEVTAIANSQSINFTGLTEQTEYAITMASICASGDTSLYIPCGIITTAIYIPTCADPATAPVVEATTMTTMKVSGDDNGVYAVLEFAYGPASMTPSAADCTTSVFTSTEQATITGLSANIDYNVWYRGICQPGDTSRWSTMAVGRTTYSDWFMPQNPHVVGYPSQTTTIAWGGCPEADKYWYEISGDRTLYETTTDTAIFLNLTDATNYTFRVCAIKTDSAAEDTTAWVYLSFKTLSEAATMPYICDFENATENNNWMMYNASQANYFTIDSIDFEGMTRALFVTNDGTTNDYSNTPSTVYATRTVSMMAGIYNVQYNWVCAGEPGFVGGTAYDYPRFFLAPVMMQFNAGIVADGITYTELPDGCIALDEGTHLTQALSKRIVNQQIYVPYTGIYNIVVFWANDNGTANDPAITIDNLNIYPQQCVAPAATICSVGETTARAAVTNYSQTTSSIVYALSYGTRNDAFLTDTMAQPDTISLTGLTIGTAYNLYVASGCAGQDESLWTKVSFRTNCGTIDVPYSESFEQLDYFYTAPGAINSICWSDLNAGANYSDYPNYRAATSGSMVTDGQRALQLNGSTTRDLYVILPTMVDPTNAQMAFDLMYEDAATCGTLYVGYMTDPADATTFTTVLTTQRITSFIRLNAIYGSIPANARLAFKYEAGTGNGAYVVIDNLRISKIVNGATYNETICYAEGYTGHGFTIPASQLSVGLNTFTRIATGAAGCPDTVYTANITMRNEIATNYYDTICSGFPYSGYGFNIPSPVSMDYTNRHTSYTGCDSTVYLHLYVVPGTETIYDTICNGSSIIFHGQTLTAAGTYSATYTNARGCSVSATLYLTVDATTHVDYETICKGDSYLWNGNTYSQAGTYPYSGLSRRGCQVNDTLHLYVIDGDTAYTEYICSGKSYYFIDTLITTAGVYTRTFVDPMINCTVTHTLTVVEAAAKTEHIYANACEGKPFYGYGIKGLVITSDTLVTINTTAMDMCDSIAYIHLTMTPTVYKDIYHTMKEGDHYTFDDQTLTKSGDYTAYYQTKDGCDSIVTLHLTVGTSIETIVDVRIELIPNPVNPGEMAMIYGNFSDIERVDIVNSFGQTIESFAPTTYPIEVRGIETSGIYFVRLTTNTGTVHVEKLIVK